MAKGDRRSAPPETTAKTGVRDEARSRGLVCDQRLCGAGQARSRGRQGTRWAERQAGLPGTCWKAVPERGPELPGEAWAVRLTQVAGKATRAEGGQNQAGFPAPHQT